MKEHFLTNETFTDTCLSCCALFALAQIAYADYRQGKEVRLTLYTIIDLNIRSANTAKRNTANIHNGSDLCHYEQRLQHQDPTNQRIELSQVITVVSMTLIEEEIAKISSSTSRTSSYLNKKSSVILSGRRKSTLDSEHKHMCDQIIAGKNDAQL
jgi:hypothetical protein